MRAYEEEVLRECLRKWGDLLRYIFDRGDGSGPWRQLLHELQVRLVIRWKKGHGFFARSGAEKKGWQMGRGKKYLAHQQRGDSHTGEKMPCDSWWAAVRHAADAYARQVVKVRVQKQVWYLITTQPVQTEAQGWEIVFAGRRRWHVETALRYGKCELGMQSPRLWDFENRLKLLALVTVVDTFLLSLLEPLQQALVKVVLPLHWHRTGKRCQEVQAALSRLRWAISRLCDDVHPILGSLFPPHLQTIRAVASLGCWTASQKSLG